MHVGDEARHVIVLGHGERQAVVEVGVALALRFGELPIPPLDAVRVAHRKGGLEVERRYGTRRTSLPKKSRPLITSCAFAASDSSNVLPTTPLRPP
jgi:hypothetical protein